MNKSKSNKNEPVVEEYIPRGERPIMREIIVITVFLLLVLFAWAWISGMQREDGAYIIYDYRSEAFDLQDINQTVAIFYNLSWEAYPENFYAPEDFEAGITEQPGLWDDSVQYATYRLRLILTPGVTYGIYMRSNDYAMRIYIDGKETDSVGVPGTTRETTVPMTNYRTYFFTPLQEQTDIIVHTSNFVHREGAYADLLRLGSYQNINRERQIDLFIHFLIAGSLLTSVMYHLALYLVNRRRKTELIFSVCCFLMLLQTKNILLFIFPSYNWQVMFRLEYIVHYAAFAMMTLFIYRLFPDVLHKRIVRGYLIISGAFIAAAVFLDTIIISNLILYAHVLSFIIMSYILICLALSLKKGRLQNWLAFAGTLILSVTAASDILFTGFRYVPVFMNWLYNFVFGAQVGMVFFILCYAMALALDHAETERGAAELRIKEQTLAAENAALDRFGRMRDDLIATVSHETMTPLAVLSGYAELVAMELRKHGVSGQIAKDLDNISVETMRIAGLIDALDSHNRKQDKRLSKVRFNLTELINGTVRLYTPILKRIGTVLTFNVSGCLPDVYAVPSEVTQILFNLLQNARNNTENGQVKINAERNGSHITVTVSDTGKGIPSELLSCVFERGVSGGGGNGVGLAVCKEIIKEHGGIINIKSESGKGTVVRFTLQVWNEPNHNEEEEVNGITSGFIG